MAIGWVGQIGTGNVQAQARALLAAMAVAQAAGQPADAASVIAANPGAYGYFLPALLRAGGPGAENLIRILGGAGGGGAAPVEPAVLTPARGWGGPEGANPAYRPQGPRAGERYAGPDVPPPSPPAAGGYTPWGAAGITFPQYYAQVREGVQGAQGAVAPSADAAARQARLRAILGMGSAAAGVTSKLRG